MRTLNISVWKKKIMARGLNRSLSVQSATQNGFLQTLLALTQPIRAIVEI